MTFDEWLKFGIENDWVGPSVCYTHDGLPTSEIEDEEWQENDPCIHVLRLYESVEAKQAIEANHSPSVWRKQ
jgi:hypothetical protein